MQKVLERKLNNGLKVNFIIDSRFNISSIYWGFRIGNFNDSEETQGLAHLFEHMVGKRTREYPAKSSLVQKLERLGVEYSAYTYSEFSLYIHRQKEGGLLDSLQMMKEAVFNSVFDQADLENEKKVVLAEGQSSRQENPHIFWKEVRKNFNINNTDIWGSEDTLKNINTEVFDQFYSNYLQSNNMEVVVCLSSEKFVEEIINDLKEISFTSKNEHGLRVDADSPKNNNTYSVVESSTVTKNGGNFSSVNVVYKTDKLTSDEMLAFEILSYLLTNGFSGQLIKKLRDEMGLVYWVQIYRDNLSFGSLITVDFSCEKSNTEQILHEIRKVILKLEITDENIDTVTELISFRNHKNNNPDNCSIDMFYKNVANCSYLTPEEFDIELRKINANDVKKLLEKIFIKGQSTLVTIN